MKVLLAGMSKSGTSILAYRIAAAIPSCSEVIFEPSNFGRNIGEDEAIHQNLANRERPLVCKCLIDPRATQSHELFLRCAKHYTRKIFLVRDPRDRELSILLYRYHWRHLPESGEAQAKFIEKYTALLELLRLKEANPNTVSVERLTRTTFSLKQQKILYESLNALIPKLDSSWLIVRYEDMIAEQWSKLNDYLGYCVTSDTEVPHQFRRVVRSKAKENWRNWYLPGDVTTYRPIFEESLKLLGYDPEDWELTPKPSLDPALGSQYVERLFQERDF